MKQLQTLIRGLALLAALTMLLAACGDGTTDEAPTASLPPADGQTDSPGAAGTCLEGEPDCEDLPGNQAPPLPLDGSDGGTDGEPVTSDGMVVDGGLEVSEALGSDITGIIAVQGFLLDDGTGARLCEALAESYPPQCGGASIPITNYEEVIDVPLASNQTVTWTDERITVFGEIIDGTLVVDPTVTG